MSRYLLVPRDKEIKKKYEKNLYDFHKRFTKLKFNNQDKIKLLDFNKKVKFTYNKFDTKKILRDLDTLPKRKGKRLSLYANYNPKTTIKGLGFNDKKKALFTIDKIKNLDKKYQVRVLNTMIYRAKYHPHYNNNMKEAVKIFQKYLASLS